MSPHMNGCILCHCTLDKFKKNTLAQRFHFTSEDNSIDTEAVVLMIHLREEEARLKLPFQQHGRIHCGSCN